MFIDVHTHLGRIARHDPMVTAEDLIATMDKYRIDKAVLLPLDSTPEGNMFTFTNEQALDVYAKYPDRIIPFCKLDPRQGNNSPTTDFSWILEEYKELGCKGVGEITANIYIDDPRAKNFFKACGVAGMPVLFHLAEKFEGVYGLVDDIYLPRLENILKEFPDTILIGHAMSFWSEISADVNEKTRAGYPKGPVEPGRLWELLEKYDNLYGDISAGSGYNAITRDPDMGYEFLDKFQDKLLFGTDYCHVGQELPIVDFMRTSYEEGKISQSAYDKITHKNAQRILGLT